jgi:hypothetical protein
LFPKVPKKANDSEQVIPITVSQIERGIENPCIDGSIPPLIKQLFQVWFNSGDYLFTSFDFNADCLPVGFRWRSGQTLEAFIKMMNTMLLMHKSILLVTNEMKSMAIPMPN